MINNMTLVRVADLAHTDIAGLHADIRSRDANGELLYSHQEEQGPRIVVMKRVTFRNEKLTSPTLQRICGGKTVGRWMYWEWEKNHNVIPFDCGYSGQLAEDEKHKEIYILLESRKG